MSVIILRTQADVCAAILAVELNDEYDGTPLVENVRIDDDINISISYDVAPDAAQLTQLDDVLLAHDCSLVDDDDTIRDNLTGEVYNNTSTMIIRGTPVYNTGFDIEKSLTTVSIAQASNPNMMPAFGTTAEDIPANSIGIIVTSGQITNIDTSTFALTDDVYVAPTGGTTATAPIGTDLVQKIGQIEFVDAIIGRCQVFGAGRANELPNLPLDKCWMGDSSGVPEEVSMYRSSQVDTLLDDKADQTAIANFILNINNESITELSDVLTSMVPVDGQVLTFDATNGWQAETPSLFAHPDPHLLNDGSTSNPTYSFGVDGDTGMYRESSGDLAFANDGLCVMEISSNGRVFISNQIPTYETLVTTDNTIPNKKYVDDAIAANTSGGIGSGVFTLTFCRESSAKNKWLSHQGDNSNYSNKVHGMLPWATKLVGMSFSNSYDDTDQDVEIYSSSPGSGSSDSKKYTWELRDCRVATNTSISPDITFAAGEKIGVYVRDKGTDNKYVSVVLYFQIQDFTPSSTMENHSGDF